MEDNLIKIIIGGIMAWVGLSLLTYGLIDELFNK